MLVTINGEAFTLEEGLSLTRLLAQFEISAEKVAIERNLTIVHAQEFEKTILADGDRIEIVHFMGGG